MCKIFRISKQRYHCGAPISTNIDFHNQRLLAILIFANLPVMSLLQRETFMLLEIIT